MKTTKIPDVVDIKSGTYTGRFDKRPGSSNDRDLFCWFHDEGDDHFPHVSIDLSYIHDRWEYFHVTFPVMKKDVLRRDKRVSYSVHVRIDPETDQVSIERTTSRANWRMSDKPSNALGFADMDRKALEFAKQFYSAAFAQSR